MSIVHALLCFRDLDAVSNVFPFYPRALGHNSQRGVGYTPLAGTIHDELSLDAEVIPVVHVAPLAVDEEHRAVSTDHPDDEAVLSQ
jgi:hypothetical protein